MTPTPLHLIAADEWHKRDNEARAAFALLRLKALAEMAPRLQDADAFDIAYAIWDDYVKDHRITDGTLTIREQFHQAQVFAQIVQHLSPHDLIALARAAWDEPAFACDLLGASGVIGSFHWSPSQARVYVDMFPSNEFDLGASWDITPSEKRRGASSRQVVFAEQYVGVADLLAGAL